jgi:ATP-binding cassette subfamily F protein 3
MFDGLCQEEPPPKKAEIEDGPPMSERDRAKLELRRRKDECQREVAYELHLEQMKASLAGMSVAHVHHGNGDEGSTVKDIHMTNFNISVGGRELIKDGSITLSHGRHYGLIGRNGTRKTTLRQHMSLHAIDGIPKNCQILHVEQEVVGDDTIALQCVLNSDVDSLQ